GIVFEGALCGLPHSPAISFCITISILLMAFLVRQWPRLFWSVLVFGIFSLGQTLCLQALQEKSVDVGIHFKERRNPPFLWIEKLGGTLRTKIENEIPFPENKVLAAILLGDQSAIPFSIRNDCSRSGTAHLLAISGGNIVLIALLTVALLRFFRIPLRSAYFLTLLFLAIYCILTGTSPSVLRATLMCGLTLLGWIIGRETEMIVSLSWAAFWTLLLYPLEIFDIGFQLSYITVLALGLFQAMERDSRKSRSEKRPSLFLRIGSYLEKSFMVSCVSWIGIMPLIAHYFSLWNPIVVITNLVAVPYFALVLFSGLAFLLLGAFHPVLSECLALAAWFLTKGFILLSHLFSSIPYGHFKARPPDRWEWTLYMGMIFLCLLKDYFKLKVNNFVMILLLILNLAVWKGI
ncbi:MAG: ComEC/Rec2 family competence protein, partial [Elusimicrobia bacterium]|nr:ComEC/Rec2 family competence protein [Elusimicrobiota bacterium]